MNPHLIYERKHLLENFSLEKSLVFTLCIPSRIQMDHLRWYESSTIEPVRVPWVCQGKTLCGSDDFFDFPQKQGWELDQSESLSQLAERAQAWLFFGILAVMGVHPDACVSLDAGEYLVTTKMLPYFMDFTDRTMEERVDFIVSKLIPALFMAENVIREELIPLVRSHEALESLDLWTSKPYAILFSIETLLESIKDSVAKIPRQFINSARYCDADTVSTALRNLPSGSLFPKLTGGVARSLLRIGRCGSLVHCLDLSSSEFYQLMSLPISHGQVIVDHSQCNKTSCTLFNVNQMVYRTQHTRDCVLCNDGVGVVESDLVNLIRKDEVPVIRSTLKPNGKVTICVEKMTKGVDYIAISHVWAGGLGNFVRNQLPQCQLQAIHEDVEHAMISRFSRENHDIQLGSGYLRPQTIRALACLCWLPESNTVRYWMDTLCIPNNSPAERKSAINSMGRIYAGAAAVLVLDPTLRSISHEQVGDIGANILIKASPWMARSWPLQEAALASEIYVRFAEGSVRFEHQHLGIEARLQSLPNHASDEGRLNWFSLESDENFVTGDCLPYTPDSDFIKAWNLLSKRTTSYPEDVPAIFAILIYKSAGEILSIEPAHRTWALLSAVDTIPLDILCVEQESHLPRWVPRLPGSVKPVPSLDPTLGVLERVASGLLLQLSQIPTNALICAKGLSASGGYFLLHEGHFQQSFLVHLPIPPETDSKSKSRCVEVEESHLILMLPKRLSSSSSANCGILARIRAQTGDALRVQLLSTTITWSCHNDQEQLPTHEFRDCLFADPSYSVLIEMGMSLQVLWFTTGERLTKRLPDTTHWPSLRWSRFGAYPYRHLQAQAPQGLLMLYIFYVMLNFAMFIPGFCLWVYNFSQDSLVSILVVITLPLRIYLDCLYYIHLDVKVEKRGRYLWSLSFWDVPKSRATLSKLPFSIPWYFMLVDLIILAGVNAAFMKAPKGYSDTNIALLVIIPIGYLLRLLMHLFLQVQWFLSTLDHRNSFLQQPTVFMLTKKFIISSLHANFSTALITFVTGSVGAPALYLSYFVLRSRRDPDWSAVNYILVFVFGVPGFGFLCLSLYLLFKISRDLIRRGFWVFGKSGWAGQRRIHDREDAFVLS